MGAYENPQTVVDRQSGQIWANTIKSVTKSTVDYIDFVGQKKTKLAEEIKKQNQWATDYALNQSEKVQSNLTKLKAKGNAAIKASDIVDGLTNTAMSMRQAQTQEEFKKAKVLNSKFQQRLQQLYTVIEADNASQKFYQEEFDPSIEGLQGGMDLTGKRTLAYVQAQTVNNGLAAGKKEYYYDSENEEWRVKFLGENFEGKVDEVALSFFNYDPGKITNINSMIDGAYEEAGWLKGGLPTDAAISENQYTASIEGTDKRGLYAKTATGKIATSMTPIFEAQAESFFQDIPAARGIWGIISKELEGEGKKINFIEADLVKQGSQMQQDFINAYTMFASKRMPPSVYMDQLVDSPKGPKQLPKWMRDAKNLEDQKTAWQDRLEQRVTTLGLGINKEGEVFTGEIKPFNAEGNIRPEFEKALSGIGYSIEKKINQDVDSDNPKAIAVEISMPGITGNKVRVFQDQIAQDFIYNLGLYTFGSKQMDWAGKYSGKFKGQKFN